MFIYKQNKSHCRAVIAFLSLIWITPCFATMDVMDEETEGFYGNAETRPFRDIIDDTETLTQCDKDFLEGVIVTRITERTYVRALVGKPTVRISTFNNKSSPPVSSLSILNGSFSNRLYSFLLAFGHIWEHWAIEGEFFATKQQTHTFSPIILNFLTLGPQSATVKYDVFALFFNVSYILPRWFDICPIKLQIHLDAGAGTSLKVANLTFNDALGLVTASNSRESWAVAGQLGAGIRYQMTPHFLVDFVYRYMSLGKVNYGPIQVGPSLFPALQQTMKFQSKEVTTRGFYIGLTYQF